MTDVPTSGSPARLTSAAPSSPSDIVPVDSTGHVMPADGNRSLSLLVSASSVADSSTHTEGSTAAALSEQNPLPFVRRALPASAPAGHRTPTLADLVAEVESDESSSGPAAPGVPAVILLALGLLPGYADGHLYRTKKDPTAHVPMKPARLVVSSTVCSQ